MDQECSVVLSKLVTSKQLVEDIEKKVVAKSMENLLIKRQILELAGFAAEGSIAGMPEHWTLEEQHTAFKLGLRAIKEEETGEEVSLIVLVDKDLPAIVHLTYEENEILGKQASTLGRKVVELTGIIAGMTENKGERVTSFIQLEYLESEYKQQEDNAVNEDKSSVVNGHISQISDDMMKVDINGNYEERSELETKKGRLLVKSSKAKLKKINSSSSSTGSSPLLSVSPNNAVSKFHEQEIRHLEGGHDFGKDDQLMEEETSSKFGCKTGNTEKMQPCHVVLTGLAPDILENNVRKYEGVTQVRMEGDTAVMELMNAELASRFRGQGDHQIIDGYSLEVGKVVVDQDSLLAHGGYVDELDGHDHSKDYTAASIVDKDVITSVAVRVKRMRGLS